MKIWLHEYSYEITKISSAATCFNNFSNMVRHNKIVQRSKITNFYAFFSLLKTVKYNTHLKKFVWIWVNFSLRSFTSEVTEINIMKSVNQLRSLFKKSKILQGQEAGCS